MFPWVLFGLFVLEVAEALGEDDDVPGIQSVDDRFGVVTGAAGIRGVSTFRSFTPAQMDAMRRKEAAEGHLFASMAL